MLYGLFVSYAGGTALRALAKLTGGMRRINLDSGEQVKMTIVRKCQNLYHQDFARRRGHVLCRCERVAFRVDLTAIATGSLLIGGKDLLTAEKRQYGRGFCRSSVQQSSIEARSKVTCQLSARLSLNY